MITSETPYKLAEIYRATWPNLYKNEQISYNTFTTQKEDDTRNNGRNAGTTGNCS